MFPEYRDLITKLKNEDAHFARLFDKHNEIDQKLKTKKRILNSPLNRKLKRLKKKN